MRSPNSLRLSRPTRHLAPVSVASTESPEQSEKYFAFTVCQVYVVSCQPVTEHTRVPVEVFSVTASTHEQLRSSSMFGSSFTLPQITLSHIE